MVIGWVTVLAGFGLAGGLTRYLPYYRGKSQEFNSAYIFHKARPLLLISGIIGLLVVCGLSGFISTKIFDIANLKTSLIVFSFAIPFTLLAGVYFSILKSYEEIGWLSFISNILQNVVKLGVLVILIYAGFATQSIAISYLIGVSVAFILSYIVVKKRIPLLFVKTPIKDSKIIMNQLMSYSWPLIFFGLVASLLSWTDTFMIGVLRSTSEVGFYNAAVPIALLITISTDLFRQMFLTLITKEYGRGKMTTVKIVSQQVTKWLFITSIPLFVALFVFPGEAINLFFGSEYLPAVATVRILSIGFFVTAILDVSQEILSMKGMSRLILVDTLILAAIDALMNYLLIPIYGINGAAISTTLSLVALSILFTYQVWNKTSIWIIKKESLMVAISGFISFTLTLLISRQISLISQRLFIGGLVFISTYVCFLYLTKSLDSNDAMIIKAIKSKIKRLTQNKLNAIKIN
jgi:O-antigen/teichoic acid export membrane protein